MTAIPWQILNRWAAERGLAALTPEKVGVGMLFLPHDAAIAEVIHQTFEQIVQGEGLKVLGWRSVPVKPEVLGPLAKQYQPLIEQLIVESAQDTGDDLERTPVPDSAASTPGHGGATGRP